MSSELPPTSSPASSGKAIASLLLGVFSLGFSLLTAIPAIVLGIISLGQSKRESGRNADRGLAVGGIAAAIAGTLVNLAFLLVMFLPVFTSTRRPAENMHEIVNALGRFQYAHGMLPSAYGSAGKPPTSWRARALPYLEQGGLLDQYDFQQPWDGESNRAITAKLVPAYHHPADGATNVTRYLALVGPGTAFDPGTILRLQDFSDGVANTIVFVEANSDRAVPWAEPKDLSYDPSRPLEGIGHERLDASGTGQFLAAMGDGSVHSLSGGIDPEMFRALASRNGGGKEIDPGEFVKASRLKAALKK